MRRAESRDKDSFIRWARRTGRYARRVGAGPFVATGTLDVHVVLGGKAYGRACWLEFKIPGESATRVQVAEIAALRRAGAVAEVVHSAEEAEQCVLAYERGLR